MTFTNYILESTSLVIVDIQPKSENFIPFVYDFIEYINKYKGDIYYLYNGPELGYDDFTTLYNWLIENGAENSVLDRINFIEKDYGWIRDPMDRYDHDDIVDVLKIMVKKGYNDSRELKEKDLKDVSIDFKNAIIDEDTVMWLPEIMKDLKRFPNSGIIIGGGRDECLLEIELTLEAIKKKFKRNRKLVY
jgi:hypothetical protein